jgi:hypothetical protein
MAYLTYRVEITRDCCAHPVQQVSRSPPLMHREPVEASLAQKGSAPTARMSSERADLAEAGA